MKNTKQDINDMKSKKDVDGLINVLEDANQDRDVRRESAKSLQFMYLMQSMLDDASRRKIKSVEWLITKMIEDVEEKKKKALEKAKVWWLGKPDPKDAEYGTYVCDACNGSIHKKEGTSMVGRYMRCSLCTERLFERWDEGKD